MKRPFVTLALAGLSILIPGFVKSQTAPAERVKWTTSRLRGAPDPPPPYQLIRAFPQVAFHEPVFIAQDPTSERIWIGEYKGKIYSFLPTDPAGTKSLVLDIERGLSAFSFHPKYKENGQIFVFSHAHPDQKQGEQVSQIHRYVVDRANPPVSRKDSLSIIVEWPGGGHNGGEAIIGPDGYLYVATGDSTGGSDLKATGQGVDDLLSVMMRIDVDHPDPGRAYSIPKDNPFVGVEGARPEIWAYGYRNPWRFSFDPVTGRPWVGDVGQDIWEMIELSHKGANHGWSVMEGSHNFHPHKKAGPGPFTKPVVEHHHTECRSITGGYVYQGSKFPELKGAYIYGDYEYGKVWALRYDYKNEKVTWHKELADTTVKISSFGVGRDGSFWAVDYNNGNIYQLARRTGGDSTNLNFPRKLSDTGLFTSVKDHRMAPGVVAYSINAPFWSDGAHKERYFALPGEAKVELKEKGAWDFDDGAVTVKSFTLDMEEGNPKSGRKIETRIVLKQDNHWIGYTYAWNDAQTDAFLVDAKGMDRVYPVKDPSAPGGIRKQTWHYPSRNECMFCHSRASGFVLGIDTPQMNRDGQIEKLISGGYFRKAVEKPVAQLAKYPDPFDESVEIGSRVKTYLQVNCAICHVPDGGGNAPMDLGYHTPFAKAKLIGEKPVHDTLNIADALVVAPGSPEKSVLYGRITRRGPNQMPPTSTNRVDAAGAKLIEAWIKQLQ